MNNRPQHSRLPKNNSRYNNPKNGKRNPARRNGGGSFNVANASSARSKYIEKAKEALSEGDRVAAENFFQHADHYNRLITETEERRANDNNWQSEQTIENNPTDSFVDRPEDIELNTNIAATQEEGPIN